MAAEVQDGNLQKVDSAIADEPASPSEIKAKAGHRRTSSTVSGVFNIADLGEKSLSFMGCCRVLLLTDG